MKRFCFVAGLDLNDAANQAVGASLTFLEKQIMCISVLVFAF